MHNYLKMAAIDATTIMLKMQAVEEQRRADQERFEKQHQEHCLKMQRMEVLVCAGLFASVGTLEESIMSREVEEPRCHQRVEV